MQNSVKFLQSFNLIERHLRKKLKEKREASFYALVEAASKFDSVINKYKEELKEYADLRNAIVHERTGGTVIAEPNDYAVKNIEHLASLIMDPPKVYPLFRRKVFSISVTESIGAALKLMYENSFSQLPIYKGEKFIDLLTNNTIARWLGSCVEEDIFSLGETPIGEVLKFTEIPDNYFFLDRDAPLVEAMEKFQYFESIGSPLDAIIITQNGKPTEAPLGIITTSDFPKILLELNK